MDSSSTPSKDGTLVDPSTVSMIGAVSYNGSISHTPPPPLPPLAAVPEKKAKKDKPSTSKSKKPVESKSATDKKMEELDQKWLDRFNRLQVLLMAMTLQPAFSSAVKVIPSHTLSANVAKDTEPFFQLTTSEHTGTAPSAMHQLTIQLESDPHLSSERTGKDSSAHSDTGSPVLHRQRKDSASSFSSGAGSHVSDRPPVDLDVEEGELLEDQDMTVTKPEQALSEDHTYRETMRGIRSSMDWSNIPEMDSSNTASDDNHFSGPKVPVPEKVSVQMPTEEWLCRKLSKLNLTLVEGYPSHCSEAGGLMRDQFLRPAKSQSPAYTGSSKNVSATGLAGEFREIRAGAQTGLRLCRLPV